MARAPSGWAARFATIRTIVPEVPATWENHVFLTIDVDWAVDEVLGDTIDILERAGVAATFFITHRTPLLERLRANARFELGIHPNFNPLLTGGPGRSLSAADILAEIASLVPEARSIRSHSMTQSSRLLDLFQSRGLTHDCNHFIPANSGITLKPYRHWNGLVRAPYFWEDDIDLIYDNGLDIARLRSAPGLRVFDFHPIHVALNSTSIEAYERCRHAHHDWKALREHACIGAGVRTALERLLQGDREGGAA